MHYQSGAKRPNLILPKGEYPARITNAEEQTSKAGNPMLVVSLDVFDGDRTKMVRDYIVTGGEYPADWKIGHLVRSAGLDDDGDLDPAMLIERPVRVKLKVKPAKGDYQEDNAVDDYLEKPADEAAAPPKSATAVPKAAASDDQEPPF